MRAALRRHEEQIDDMNREWGRAGGLCCPGCMFGKYSRAVAQFERTARWLIVLLCKRGRHEDNEEARDLARCLSR